MIDPVEPVRIPAVFSEQEMLFVCKFLLQENGYMELIADMALTIFLVRSFSPKLRWTELQHKWCIATWQRDHELRSSAFPDWGTLCPEDSQALHLSFTEKVNLPTATLLLSPSPSRNVTSVFPLMGRMTSRWFFPHNRLSPPPFFFFNPAGS